MREELELIWNTRPLAFTMHLAGWIDTETAKQKNLGYYENKGLMPYKGKKLNPKLISRKAAIAKHQRLG